MTLTQFCYGKLSCETNFRLFRFEQSQPCPAIRPDKLEIHLFDVDFDDPPVFEAVSYAWGQDIASSAIVCNGQQLLVTPNVEAVLRVLSTQPESVGTFWIDSICIDQLSVSEKNIQVPRIRSIYSEARVVWIWLGTSSFETSAAFRFLVEAANMIERLENSSSQNDSQSSPPSQSSYELGNLFRCFRGRSDHTTSCYDMLSILDQVYKTRSYYDSVDTNFIVELLNLAWFHRTWT
jgi:hypothetical protein